MSDLKSILSLDFADALLDAFLGEAGDAVRGVGQPQAVPMEGGRSAQIVDQRDLDAVALADAQLGAWNETLAAIRVNPRVAVLVRPKGAPPMRFYGEAHVVEDPAQREAVYQRVIPEEQARDPDKKGLGVLIRVDRIRKGPQSIKR